jgi:hypothetical protein
VTASRRTSTPQNRRETGREGMVPGGEAHRFKPGQSGNPGGRPKTGALSQACRAVLEKTVPGDRERRTYAQAIAERLADLAMRGHLTAAREIGDRAEGRVGLSDVAKSSEPALEDTPLGHPGAGSPAESKTQPEREGEEPRSREVNHRSDLRPSRADERLT